MSNLTKRLIVAIIGVPLILSVIYVGGIIFFLFISAIIVLGITEFYKLIESNEFRPSRRSLIISSLVLSYGAYSGSFTLMMFFTTFILLFMIYQLKEREFSRAVTKLGLNFFPLIYFGWLFSHSLLLRNIGNDDAISEFALKNQGLTDPGFFFLVLAIAITFLNDSGAYFVGNIKGKNRLAPSISPGKTVEGTVGGIFISILSAFLFNWFFSSPLSFSWCIVFGFFLSIAAIFGDLVESAMKRGAGVKDSGGFLPGHGGILDRFDSLFFVFPVSYYISIIYYYLSGLSLY